MAEITIGKGGCVFILVFRCCCVTELKHLCEGSDKRQRRSKGMDETMWQVERKEREMGVRGSFTCRWHQKFYKTTGKTGDRTVLISLAHWRAAEPNLLSAQLR